MPPVRSTNVDAMVIFSEFEMLYRFHSLHNQNDQF